MWQDRQRAEQWLAQETQRRATAEQSLQGAPVDFNAPPPRKRSGRMLAAAALLAAVGGTAYYSALQVPVAVAPATNNATTQRVTSTPVYLNSGTPVGLQFDMELPQRPGVAAPAASK